MIVTNNELKMTKGNRILQYAAMGSGALSGITSGINIGWSSPYLPYLQNSTISHIPTTSEEASWCAVVPLLGAPIGALATTYLVDKCGRKLSILGFAPISAASFVAIAFAKTIKELIGARFVIGITEGAIYTALPMYLGEISDPSIRGFVGSSISVAALIGYIFISIIGSYIQIFHSALICMCVPIIHFLTFIWMPESPYFYFKQGNSEEARKSLIFLRGTKDVSEELIEISEAVKRQQSCKRSKFSDLITVPSNRRACFIYLILSFTNKYSGKNPILFYATTIFATAGGSFSPVISVTIFSATSMFAILGAILTVDRFGRRPLMLFSSIGCGLALAGEAFYFTAQNFYPEILSYMGWLPITSLIVYNTIFSLGLNMGPVLFLSELFPMSIKAKALGVADSVSAIIGTSASKYFHATNEQFGMYVSFWTFCICSLIGAVFIYCYVPETKGKTLEEIQLELIGLSNKKNNKEENAEEK